MLLAVVTAIADMSVGFVGDAAELAARAGYVGVASSVVAERFLEFFAFVMDDESHLFRIDAFAFSVPLVLLRTKR